MHELWLGVSESGTGMGCLIREATILGFSPNKQMFISTLKNMKKTAPIKNCPNLALNIDVLVGF